MAWFKWIKELFKSNPTNEIPPSVVIPPARPIPEIPTKEEVNNFPIEDFKFVDSSHHHKFFDVKKYTAKILSNKCTQGTGFVDDTHAIRKKLCAENGIGYSGYHFYECKKDPIAQAQFYVKTHGTFNLAPQVDFETSEGVQTEKDLFNDKEDLYKCLKEVQRLTGKTPWLYMNLEAARRLKFDKKFDEFIAWFARYNSEMGEIPYPWTKETTGAWQFTEKGLFPGFQGGNDVNIYYGKVNAAELA